MSEQLTEMRERLAKLGPGQLRDDVTWLLKRHSSARGVMKQIEHAVWGVRAGSYQTDYAPSISYRKARRAVRKWLKEERITDPGAAECHWG